MEEIMIGREMNPREMIPEEGNQEGAKIFGKLAGASLLYALVYTGCLFENVMGLASVLWVAASVWYVRFVFRMFGKKERRDNGIVLGMMGLLGISTVLTGNEWIGWMNDLIIFVLLVGILLHNFAQDAGWNFGKYLAEIAAAVCGAVCFIGKPFADGGAFYRSKKTGESHAGWYVLIGICAAVPCLMVLVLLLMVRGHGICRSAHTVCGSVPVPGEAVSDSAHAGVWILIFLLRCAVCTKARGRH